eukprot:g32832.t1
MVQQNAPNASASRSRSASEVLSPVTLTRLSEETRVAVNRKELEPGQTWHLQNGDQIFLGRWHALKLVCPGEGAAPVRDDLVLERDEIAKSELDNSASWKRADVQPSCEANEITRACRPEALYFEVDLTSTFPPCVAIRVLQCDKGRDCKDEEEWKNRYLWSVRQLNERLDRMRDYWAECQNSGKAVELQALEDPWHEAEPTEIFERMRHLEILAEDAEKAFKLRVETDSALLRLTFARWKTYIGTAKRERTPNGRAKLVKAGSGRMRTTIVPDKAFGGSRKLQTDKTPTPSGRRMTLKWTGVEKSAEKQAETPLQNHQRGSVLDKSPATQLQIAHAQTGTPCTPMQAQDKSAGPPREGSTQSLLASADALAFATRAAMDAAKAVKKAKFQSGIAALPFSSPGLAVKQHLQFGWAGYTAEPVARSASPAMTPSPSSYRIALGASRSGAMTPSMPTASSRRSWEAVPQLSQSCQAIAQLPINPSAYRMPGAYTPSPSPRGRQAQRVDLRTSSTPSPSPRAQVPVAPVAQHFPAPQTGPRRFQTPPVQPANANWLYSQPISRNQCRWLRKCLGYGSSAWQCEVLAGGPRHVSGACPIFGDRNQPTGTYKPGFVVNNLPAPSAQRLMSHA